MRRLTHLLVLTAFIFSCGGQWYFLQGVAWVRMIHDYYQIVPFTEAVSMTFSGKYPCTICQEIAEKKKSDDAKVLTVFQHEKKFLPSTFSIIDRSMTVSSQTFFIREQFFQTVSETPPTPPPRFA